jgi:serine/threonine-protein kinase HipA
MRPFLAQFSEPVWSGHLPSWADFITTTPVFRFSVHATDAHAKNYSLLLSGPDVRLAPLYDIASILPYDEVDLRKAKLAMKIGGEYRVNQIGLRQWQKFAREARVNVEQLVEVLIFTAKQLPDEVAAARSQAREEGLNNALVGRLATQLIDRARECQRLLGNT